MSSFSGEDHNDILAGSRGYGIYRTTNDGVNWVQTSLSYDTINAILVYNNSIIAGSHHRGIFLSEDNGNTWVQKNEGIGNITIYSLTLNNGNVYAGTDGKSVIKRPLSNILTNISQINNNVPQIFFLSQNFPNPFNPTTKIRFDIPPSPLERAGVRLIIYDLLGREVTTLVNEGLLPGTYEVSWDGSGFSSGVYFYNLITNNYTETKKMILLK